MENEPAEYKRRFQSALDLLGVKICQGIAKQAKVRLCSEGPLSRGTWSRQRRNVQQFSA